MPGCFEWVHCGSKTESITRGHEDSEVTPTRGAYALETGQTLAVTLKNVAGMIPVPFLSELAEVTVTVLELCEETIAIEKDVKGLQTDIYTLTLAIIDKSDHSEQLRREISKLQNTLEKIRGELDVIKKQNKWLLAFYRKVNKEKVDKCRGDVAQALRDFQVSHEIRVEDVLQSIKSKFSHMATDIAVLREDVAKLVKNTHNAHTAPSSLSREDMPTPRTIHGRQAFVEDVTSLLVSEPTSRVCITGVGGMGKTSVALAVTQSDTIKQVFQKEYVFWVPCIEAKSADLLRRKLFTQLRITAMSYDSLDPIITELSTPEEDGTKARRLILLDNFETPWLDGADREKVRDSILAPLMALPHLALLVTMTSGSGLESRQWQHRPLKALDPATARIVFQERYSDAGGTELTAADDKLDAVLTSIGHIPLAITLMAAHGGGLRISPDELLEEWGKIGTEMISRGGERSMDDVIGTSIHRGVMKSDPDALPLLAVLSLLPAGTIGNNLKWWAPELSSVAVHTLHTQPFATSRISVRPTIQAYMTRQNRIPADVQEQVHLACYKFVLSHRSEPDDPSFKADIQALANEETNIQGLLMQINAQDIRPNALDALIAFSLYQSWTKPSIVVALHALEVAKGVYEAPQIAHPEVAARQVAEAHRCVGRTLFRLDYYDEASQHFDVARQSFKNLSDRHSAGECALELARTWRFREHRIDLPLLVEEAYTDLSHDPAQEYYCARGLLGLGHHLWWICCMDEAVQNLSAANTLFTKLNRRASTADCLYIMARCYAFLHQYLGAYQVAQEAWKEVQQCGEVYLTCDIAQLMAGCLIRLKLYDAATDIVQQSIPLSRALGSPLIIGQMLERLGYCSAARMDLTGTIASYAEARAQPLHRGSPLTNIATRSRITAITSTISPMDTTTWTARSQIDRIAAVLEQEAVTASDFVITLLERDSYRDHACTTSLVDKAPDTRDPLKAQMLAKKTDAQ
ncbi:hypothetical protein B0H13DRAFT_2661121 [Mycena leptocephala]|nr:hypothetical protein B0H13DRAFT_2661121 [Mycena leptocephala]